VPSSLAAHPRALLLLEEAPNLPPRFAVSRLGSQQARPSGQVPAACCYATIVTLSPLTTLHGHSSPCLHHTTTCCVLRRPATKSGRSPRPRATATHNPGASSHMLGPICGVCAPMASGTVNLLLEPREHPLLDPLLAVGLVRADLIVEHCEGECARHTSQPAMPGDTAASNSSSSSSSSSAWHHPCKLADVASTAEKRQANEREWMWR
jgi:hypothetical protein